MLLKTVINSTRMNYQPAQTSEYKKSIAALYCKDFDTIYVCGVYLSNIGVTNG